MKLIFAIILCFLSTGLLLQAQTDSTSIAEKEKQAAKERISLIEVGTRGSTQGAAMFQLDSFTYNDIPFHFIDLKESGALIELSQRLPDDNFPFILIRKNALQRMQRMLSLYNRQYANSQRYMQYTRELEMLYDAQLKNLQIVTELQEKRTNNFKTLSDSLYADAQNMSQLLDRSMEATDKALKGNNRRNIWIGIVGGAVGFLTAALVID